MNELSLFTGAGGGMTKAELLRAIERVEADNFSEEVIEGVARIENFYDMARVLFVVYAKGVRAGQPTFNRRAAIADSKIEYYIAEAARDNERSST